MDQEIKDGAAQHRAAQQEGQRLIRHRWRELQTASRAALTDCHMYSDYGERLDPEAGACQLQDDIERLEHALGVLKQCVAARLPPWTKKRAPVPVEATDDEVISSCEILLAVPAWHDPVFLRMALSAVIVHEQANALSMAGSPTSNSTSLGCVSAVLKLGLFLLLPAALAAGIAAAVRQDVGASALAFYVVGAGVLTALSAVGVGVKKDNSFDRAYSAWTRFQLERRAGVAGLGALEHLKRMADDGIKVPSVAFDVAEMLRCRMGRQEISKSQ